MMSKWTEGNSLAAYLWKLAKQPAFWLGIIFLVAAILAHGQASPELKPSEVQMLRLEVKQKTALLAQRDVNDAQTRFNQALTELQDEAKKVEEENKWTDAQFNPQDLTFKPMPKPAEKK
jgi:hypothetical protein